MKKFMTQPYISAVSIRNFRNFKEADFDLSHKQVIIGENNTGKTNFLRALQLILDPKLSDEDRYLGETDFFDGIDSPMENGEEIYISIEIRGFEHNKTILSVLADSTIRKDPPTLKLTYKFFPEKSNDGTFNYEYKIYQGNREEVSFTHYHRRFFNLKIIQAIRDVESEMRNIRRSPINNLLKDYDFKKEELEEIAKGLKASSDEVLNVDEIVHLTKSINGRFSDIIGDQIDSNISLGTIDLDASRILNSLKIMIGQTKRATSETSLGLTNILYISLVLLSLEDKTIPFILQEDTYLKLIEADRNGILTQAYKQNESGKYILKEGNEGLSRENFEVLYSFMEDNFASSKGTTILAIEEPESHLHPALQRVIFKDVMKNENSVLMTTHSPYITSVAPIDSIVHLRGLRLGTKVKTTASLMLEDREKKDLERYIDVKKGEIYFGKAVILVEGVAEEYLVPKFADLLQSPLDKKGIICCNINSTNFRPFVKFLEALGIPYVVITDGDYYYQKLGGDVVGKVFGKTHEEKQDLIGYDGLDRVRKLLIELGKLAEKNIPDTFEEQNKLFNNHGFYIGEYTLEIDVMKTSNRENTSQQVLIEIFNDLTAGGERQKNNFRESLLRDDYVSCLSKIENKHSEIGKGRFAQRLSVECKENAIPEYMKHAIKTIYSRVDNL